MARNDLVVVPLQQADDVTRIEHLVSGLLVRHFQLLEQRHSEKELSANHGDENT